MPLLAVAWIAAGCSQSTPSRTPTATPNPSADAGSGSNRSADRAAGASVSFTAEVWADNWFALYANGKKVGEDSVSITTERSFNAETIDFDASYPLTVAWVTKDYTEDDSGLEYVGTERQQMGDGGFIAQVTDNATGTVIAATGPRWKSLVINRAPLNTDCEHTADPKAECRSESVAEPAGWAAPVFDDAAWVPAVTFTPEQVGTKDGYDTISWDPGAELIWSSDLKVDNAILWRFTAPKP